MSNIKAEVVARLAHADQLIASDKQLLARMIGAYRDSLAQGRDPIFAIGAQTLANLSTCSHHHVSLLLAVAVSMLAEHQDGTS